MVLCPFVQLLLLSEMPFPLPASHLPNVYFFSKPSSITVSCVASLFTPQTPFVSLSEFRDISVILLLNHLPHHIIQHSLQISLPPKVVFGVLEDQMGPYLFGYPNGPNT